MSWGPPIRRAAPAPVPPEWVPYKPGIERHAKTNRLRTVGAPTDVVPASTQTVIDRLLGRLCLTDAEVNVLRVRR